MFQLHSSTDSRLFHLLVLLFLLLMAASSKATESLDIRVGNFYPNYYKNSEKQWEGLDVEMAVALVERAGFTPNVVEIPWSRALIMARQGQVDVLVNVNITEERSEYLHWIGPERYTQMSLVVTRENAALPISSLDDLVAQCQSLGLKFGIQPDVAYGDEFAERLRSDDVFKACAEELVGPQNDDKVLLGRLLGYFDEPLDILAERRRNPDYGLVVHPFTVIKEPVFFGVSKASVTADELKRLLVAYQSLVADGSLEAIDRKWAF
ncbi:ABC transporter substrate-binding protein [Marinobacter sp. 1_MG-2023]|uniref:substrate-binding periplasmic protein n=1 Tax=Marinobacter sp. 1_MG-2023 TaxID=3062627 RepID=UPI0026E2D24A|nr:transporter substrate-binding domain-containing protein [Marinobacter sp. 1_MG-2023]MDO6822927.1 transporter substrate-binding domain-containing protein [Marinobacter sp. 1_MG-2023]